MEKSTASRWPPLPIGSPGSSTACALWFERCRSSISVSSARPACDGEGCSSCDQRVRTVPGSQHAMLCSMQGTCGGGAFAGPEDASTSIRRPCTAPAHVDSNGIMASLPVARVPSAFPAGCAPVPRALGCRHRRTRQPRAAAPGGWNGTRAGRKSSRCAAGLRLWRKQRLCSRQQRALAAPDRGARSLTGRWGRRHQQLDCMLSLMIVCYMTTFVEYGYLGTC